MDKIVDCKFAPVDDIAHLKQNSINSLYFLIMQFETFENKIKKQNNTFQSEIPSHFETVFNDIKTNNKIRVVKYA